MDAIDRVFIELLLRDHLLLPGNSHEGRAWK